MRDNPSFVLPVDNYSIRIIRETDNDWYVEINFIKYYSDRAGEISRSSKIFRTKEKAFEYAKQCWIDLELDLDE